MKNRELFQVHRLMGRITNTPLAVTRETLEVYLAVLGAKCGLDLVPDNEGGESGEPHKTTARDSGVMVVANGNAIIPIRGTTVQQVKGLRPYSGTVGYNQIGTMLDEAMADDDVERVLFDIDSPGGEVSGLFDLVDHIYGMRGTKPMFAVANDSAYSAAYAIASAADNVYLPRTGGVGSIGVIATHFDESEAMKKAGVKPTLVYAGSHKTDFSSFKPLTKQALERLQALVDVDYELFSNTVARNRGMSVQAVKDTEARTYHGSDAVAIGLADDVRSTIGAFAASHSIIVPQAKEKNMGWTALLERFGLEDKGSDEDNQAQLESVFKRANERAEAAEKAIRDFCKLHSVQALDAMTLKLQGLVDKTELDAVTTKLVKLEAEQYVDKLMADGKITTANREWAIGAYTDNAEQFKALMTNAPTVAPGPATKVPAKSEPTTDGKSDLDKETYEEYVAEFGKDAVDAALRTIKREGA